jgi:YegS/Rv2252/BmrU family lipid kinase
MAEGGWTFIVNPRSAAGATRRRFERVRGRFVAALPGVEVRLTEAPGHATELAREAIEGGAAVVVAVGGDGTNNEVVNGFFTAGGERIDAPAAFAAVTSGTGGDLRRTFGWSLDPLDDLRRFEAGKRRTIDLGRARFVAADGSEGQRHFINIAGFGVSGDIVEKVNQGSKRLGATGTFLKQILISLASYKPHRMRLQFDDEEIEIETTEVAVANGRYFGGGLKFCPDAEVDDGIFDVTMLEGAGIGFWVRNASRFYKGTHADLPAVQMRRCAHLHAAAQATDHVPLQLDGEEVGHLPVTIDVLPHTLEIVV